MIPGLINFGWFPGLVHLFLCVRVLIIGSEKLHLTSSYNSVWLASAAQHGPNTTGTKFTNQLMM